MSNNSFENNKLLERYGVSVDDKTDNRYEKWSFTEELHDVLKEKILW